MTDAAFWAALKTATPTEFRLTRPDFPPRIERPPIRTSGPVDLRPLVQAAAQGGELAVSDNPDYPRPGPRRTVFWRAVLRYVNTIHSMTLYSQVPFWDKDEL